MIKNKRKILFLLSINAYSSGSKLLGHKYLLKLVGPNYLVTELLDIFFFLGLLRKITETLREKITDTSKFGNFPPAS